MKKNSDGKELKVAIVHDFLTALGGAERVTLALHQLFPQAPIYTLRYSEAKTRHQFAECDVRPAKLSQTLVGKSAMLSLPFLPNAIETFPLSEYDLVISSSSAYSKGVITRPDTLHICYCHTPMRYAWDWTHEYARENGYDKGLKSTFHRLITHYLRLWDQSSAKRVDRWLANSKNVAARIKKYYRSEATVIYPPVTIDHLDRESQSPTDEPYFFIVSRLSPYKKIDIAIEASARLQQPLVVIGEGNDQNRLEELAAQLKAPVAFLGFQDDAIVNQYFAHCRAFIFAGEDDFGITPVEAMSYGKPVIAYGRGGALETVIDQKTGLFFSEPTADSLTQALETFIDKESSFDPAVIKKQAERFSEDRFKEAMLSYIEKEWEIFQAKADS